jgi:hypothetical protein
MGKLKDLFSKSQEEQALQDALAQRYQQALAQSMMNTKANTLQNIYATNNTGALGQSLLGQQIPVTPRKPPRNPNDCEAYSMPLSALVNLWRAKYGDKWVDVSEIDDQFWSDASARLHRNNKMEETDLDHAPWARLREGV